MTTRATFTWRMIGSGLVVPLCALDGTSEGVLAFVWPAEEAGRDRKAPCMPRLVPTEDALSACGIGGRRWLGDSSDGGFIVMRGATGKGEVGAVVVE